MALAVKHLNGDASFLLTFDALLPGQPPYRILIDPWITGKSKILHSKISVTRHKETPCITSLAELPEPDLVVISQNKSDHCNEDSLRQLPPKDTKTIILAEPAAARTIRGWKYFEKSKVRTIPKWGDPRLTARQMIMRIKVPSASPGQIEPGEVTVAFISQRRDLSGLHGAIGITYRPPQAATRPPRPADKSFTPPITPRSCKSCGHLRPTTPLVLSQPSEGGTQTTSYSPMPPSPTNSTLRSVRSASSLATTLRDGGYSTASLASLARPLSVIFSPHGINYESLQSYTTSHLIAEAALPLTALLHCFDSVSNPWWLGGNVLLGAPAGIETASKLGARAWISTHDGDKIVKGIATSFLRTRKWKEEDVLGAMSAAELAWREEKQTLKNKRAYSSKSTAILPGSPTSTIANSMTADKIRINTDLIRLRIGEEVMLTNGPILMIDRDSLIAKVQETPTMVNNIQHDLKTPSGPILRPPPRSLNRPPPTITLGSKTAAAPVDPVTHGIDSAKQNRKEGQQQHLATDQPLTPPTTAGSASDDAASPPPLTLMPTTSTSSTLSFPEIPASFTERRYTNSGARGRGNSKTHSESDFASLEAVMMMRRFEQQN